ncbi:3-oxoacyl-[acyl-carrier-protein] reductase [Paenibacillus alvei]|uniref:3-oxoacyl-[acyl-carrier-protein] reductase n=1 Tax=Paenibacillus alvei TaxID=44250 RepID=UPI000386A841|nr:3-oxoacyl-[acyl-carrier-protein] reductase [Paenibacillus alvei]EPY14031.1 3-oxoacyl-(acyl-carrier-protein) reductase [Paenibacillus alvei A6-6i-x]
MRFDGKVILITGGSRGIGAELVREFAEEGATVLFTYKNSHQKAEQLEQMLRSCGYIVKAFELDVSEGIQVNSMFEEAAQEFGTIDILINNAGITKDTFLMIMDEGAWDSVIDTNLKGAYNCCKAVLPIMIDARSGVIINVSSVSAISGIPGQTNYSASKAGLIGFTRSLSSEVASKNIRVNAIAPGCIITDMMDQVSDRIVRSYMNKIHCGRLGEAKEVAKVVKFLASDDASYIYGQTIVVDGGMTSS